jgi:hypothetical protein
MRINPWGYCQEIVRMDIGNVMFDGMRVVLGVLGLSFIPGLAISLVCYPRLTEISIPKRLACSAGFGIGYMIVTVLLLALIPGVDIASGTLALATALFLSVMLIVWLCELLFLNKRVQKRYSRLIHAMTDRRKPATTSVVWHESRRSGRNLVDHSYLLDAGRVMDIVPVSGRNGEISGGGLRQPPPSRTRYFELFIRENREGGLSRVDDLEVSPVLVTKKPDSTLLHFLIRRGSSTITGRLCEKGRASEGQWIFSHDFHLIAVTGAEDSLDCMVDRIIAEIDQIGHLQRRGSRISSHLGATQALREKFDIVMEKPRFASEIRELQKEILRGLDTFTLTPASFRGPDRFMPGIPVPAHADVNRQLARIGEIRDNDWLFE